MLSITLHDSATGDQVKINFEKTGQVDKETGKESHFCEAEWVTAHEAIKESASPMFKTCLYMLFNGFGLAKKGDTQKIEEKG